MSGVLFQQTHLKEICFRFMSWELQQLCRDGESGLFSSEVFCCGPISGSLQGALERMSEENNVGGLLSSGSREVWIFSVSAGTELAEEKQCEWVDSALAPQGGRPEEEGRRDNCRKNGVQSNVQQ